VTARQADVERLAVTLTSFLIDVSGDEAVKVRGLHRAGEGSSRENWAFDADWSIGSPWPARLLLRRDPTGGVVETSRRTEFDLLSVLAPTGLPVPTVLWMDESGERLGRPAMVVGRHPGRAHRGVLGPADPLALGADRARLAVDMCDLLADLHAVDLRATGADSVLVRPAGSAAASELRYWTAELDREELEPHPALRLVGRWLRDHIPAAAGPSVLVHGDFRPGNVLVDNGRIGHLLDWELARIGDRHDDLGWYCTDMYRSEHFIPGVWEQDDFLRRYAERSGRAVDREAVRYWAVMAGFRLAVMGLAGVSSFVDGRSNRPAKPVDAFAARLLAGCR
jgi:aminoglycoside phosphotransferase (APT) family kinase protein